MDKSLINEDYNLDFWKQYEDLKMNNNMKPEQLEILFKKVQHEYLVIYNNIYNLSEKASELTDLLKKIHNETTILSKSKKNNFEHLEINTNNVDCKDCEDGEGYEDLNKNDVVYI